RGHHRCRDPRAGAHQDRPAQRVPLLTQGALCRGPACGNDRGEDRGPNDEISGGGAGDLLTPRERAAVRFAEKLAVDHQKVDDALWAEVRAQFSEAEVIELVAHTTLYIGWGRFNEIVGIEPA